MNDRVNDKGKDTQDVIQGYDFGKTDLASNLKGAIGSRFLGIDVDPATRRFFDTIFTQFLPHIANKVEEHGAQFIKDSLMSSGLVKDEIKAIELGKKHAGKLAWATVLAEPIISLTATGVDTTSKLNTLRLALTPISKNSGSLASVEALFGSSNEVVENARARIYSRLYTDIASTLARSVVTLPAVFAVRGRIQERLKGQTEEIDIELATKDPKKLEELVLARVKGGTQIEQTFEAQKTKQLKTMREEYIKEFDAYKKDRNGGIKARDEIIKRIVADDAYAEDLKIGYLLNEKSGNEVKRKAGIDEKALSNPTFLRQHPAVENAIEKELKYRFVEDVKGGKALNDGWVKPVQKRYSRSGEKNFNTIEDSLDQLYLEMRNTIIGKQKAAEAELKAHKSNDPNSISIFDQGIMAVASLAGNQFHKILVGNKQEELNKPVALDLILHMRKVIHEDKKEHRETNTIPNYGEKSGDSSFTKFVHQVFEEHQIDSKQSEIGSRYFEHFKEAGFKDDVIFKMADKDLSGYEVAVKHIARAIKEGRMDSIALINLVGQRKIVQRDAKHFGPKGANGAPSAIVAEIDKECACNAAQREISQEQLSELLSNFVFSEEELKAGFAAGGAFKGEEKSFLFMLLDSQVQDAEAMKRITGLTTLEMDELRKHSQGTFTKHFDAAVSAIAAMSDEEIGKLAKYDITKEEVQLIRDAAESARAAGKTVNDVFTGEESQPLKTAIANVMMAEEREGQNFWQNRVKVKANEALENAVSEALKHEKSEHHHVRLANERAHKHKHSNSDSLGIAT
jgi:hypothetical protein